MRERWKQAGLIFLSLLAVSAIGTAYALLMARIGIQTRVLFFSGFGIVCLVAYLAAVRWIEWRAPTELSLRHAPVFFVRGVIAGIVLFCLVMAGIWIAGAYRPQGWGGTSALALGIVMWIAVAIEEEILFRGLLFRLFSKVFGTWGALVASAALFGASHATNPGWTMLGLVSVALAGVMLAAAYAATGRLWLPIGLHAGWNFAEGSLFGVSVSGNDIGPGVIAGQLSGPDIWTGGRFGPEASISAVVVILAAIAFLVWRTAVLRRFEPPIWADHKVTALDTAGR